MDSVEKYLETHGVQYVKEKRFNDCKNIRPLPFDYYIPEKNICIEVDGEFHYPRNSLAINHESLYENVARRDNIKTEYCKDNNIKLIRIPYFEMPHFEEILNRELYADTEITH